MLDRRSFLFAAMATGFALPAEARLRDRIAENRNGKAGKQNRTVKPVTRDYGPALLDIYAPEGASGAPVFIHVHGGGWRNGNRKYVQSKPDWFVSKGWVFTSIDYRLLPEAPVATQANDVAAAFAWVRANIAKHGGSPDRIAVSGHSAGCHLTALTGCRGDLDGARALVLCDVDVYDIKAQADRDALRQVHMDAFPDPEQWAALSPVTHAATPHMPMLIAYSRVKGHKRSAQDFASALKHGGTHAELYDGSAYSHFSINRGFGEETGGFTGAAMDFLHRFVA